MNNDRRKFLRHTGALTAAGLVGNLGTWAVDGAQAHAAPISRLPCACSSLAAMTATTWSCPTRGFARLRGGAYARVERRAIAGAAAARSIADSATGVKYGLHPNLVGPRQTSTTPTNKMAVVANAGTLAASDHDGRLQGRHRTGLPRTCTRIPTSRWRGWASCPTRSRAPAGAGAPPTSWHPMNSGVD